ncbi:MAG: tetratricopeptide repeat protein [Bacteroidota bacterium]
MRQLLTYFFLFYSTFTLLAQDRVADSLYQLSIEAEDETTRLDHLNNVVFRILPQQPDSAVKLANENIALSQEIEARAQEAVAYLHRGNAQRRLGNYEEAKQDNHAAIDLFMMLGDSLQLAKAYQGIGNVYRQLGEYEAALTAQLTCMKLQENNDAPDTDVARTYNQIATVFAYTQQPKDALTYFQKSLAIWESKAQPQMQAICYLNIGAQHIELNNNDLAEKFLLKSKTTFESINLTYGVSAAVTNLAQLYVNQENYIKAQPMAQQALVFDSARKDKGSIANTLSLLGEIELNLGNPNEAIDYYEEALKLALELDRKETIKVTYDLLASAYDIIGDYRNAYEAARRFSEVKDSLLNEDIAQQINELQATFESEQKDQQILQLEAQKQAARREKILLWSLLGVALLLLLGIVWAWRNSKRTNRQLSLQQQETQQILAEKEALLAELKKTQGRLIQTDKMASLGQLTAGVAHEINNPISFIAANMIALKMDYQEIVNLLKKVEQLHDTKDVEQTRKEIVELSNRMNTRYLSAEINQLIGGIERGINRTKRIVKSLSIFSRNTSETFQLADINEGIDSTLQLLKSNLSDNIKIKTDFGELPEVLCQISPLNQVFLNILTNSTQAIEGKGRIQIKTWQADNQVKIAISDDGRGMPLAVQRRIFEPFFTTKEVGKGTGLGLSISYEIIQHHQGDIQVESEPGKGSTFTITLPIEPTAI